MNPGMGAGPGMNPGADGDGGTSVTRIIDRGLADIAAIDPALAPDVRRLSRMLHDPPRVALIGRIKAGKSTLVNALIEAKVAATAALECTTTVSVFHRGQPERAEIVSVDGRRIPVALAGRELRDLGMSATEVDHVDRYLSSAILDDFILIDTPGTATLTEGVEDATRRALLGASGASRASGISGASGAHPGPGGDAIDGTGAGADACLYLTDSAPRDDERAFIAELGFTPVNTIAVLSRADSFGEGAFGAEDPIDHARVYTEGIAGGLTLLARSILPVSGLLAESSSTGAITESLARDLAALARHDREDIIRDLESAEPRLLSPAQRNRLLGTVAPYGIIAGRTVAPQGARALRDWMRERSGIVELRRRITHELADIAAVRRAQRILEHVEGLAYRHPRGQDIRGVLDRLRSDPAMWRVEMYRSLSGLMAATPHSPMIRFVTAAVAASTVAEAVGLAEGASPAAVREEITDRTFHLRQRLTRLLDPAEENAATLLLTLYGHLPRMLDGPGGPSARIT